MNRKLVQCIVTGAIIASSCALTSGCAGFGENYEEEKITMNELPPAVKPLAEKEVEGCKIKEVEKETKGGNIIYAITYFDKDGVLMELEYAEDGKLISKEKE